MYDHTVLNSMVERWREGARERVREREGGRERLVDLGILMTPGFSKDIRCHYDHTVLNSMVQRGAMGTL